MGVPGDFLVLVRKLVDATAEGRVDWTETDEPGQYVISTQKGYVWIESRDNDGVRPFVLAVGNTEGRVVESYMTGAEEDDEDVEMNQMLDLLYPLARRVALRTDQTIKELIEELE